MYVEVTILKWNASTIKEYVLTTENLVYTEMENYLKITYNITNKIGIMAFWCAFFLTF